MGFSQLPAWAETKLAGLLLAIPDLLALDRPQLVRAPGHPSTAQIPASSYLRSLLALKLTATRRVPHVYDIAADPGAALCSGLVALPKATALTTYSYRLEHRRQVALLQALDRASLAQGLASGEALNLDFHAVMGGGHRPEGALCAPPLPAHPQRAHLFAEDAASHSLLCTSADLAKATQANEVMAFDPQTWHSCEVPDAGTVTLTRPLSIIL